MRMRHSARIPPLALLGLLAAGCGDDGGGTGDQEPPKETAGDGMIKDLKAALDVKLFKGLDVIEISAGTNKGQVLDGWKVTYHRFIVTIGSVAAYQPDGTPVSFQADTIVNAQSAPQGALVATLMLDPGESLLEFSAPNAHTRFSAFDGATEDDLRLMHRTGYSVYVEGTIEKPDGQSCVPGDPSDCVPAPVIAFSWGLLAGASFSDCPPIALASDEKASAALRVSGEQWFRTNFDPLDISPDLRAQWIADADLDRDGLTTLDELQMIKAESLLDPKLDYDLAGAPFPIETVHDFLAAHALMIGRDSFDGCGAVQPELIPG